MPGCGRVKRRAESGQLIVVAKQIQQRAQRSHVEGVLAVSLVYHSRMSKVRNTMKTSRRSF
ncbi:hypothetical protein KCP76_00940 [Salmonella enterica subsp. enterica serovar Weltevreden]|nr:hypothetical protein KCP76_00940 [Salmonella enterica subsp. enterica serovar Weltevreden]